MPVMMVAEFVFISDSWLVTEDWYTVPARIWYGRRLLVAERRMTTRKSEEYEAWVVLFVFIMIVFCRSPH